MSFYEWLDLFNVDLSQWTSIGKRSSDEHHLWKREPSSSYDIWAQVTPSDGDWDGPVYEYRECVLCGAKQIREPQS